MNPLGLSIFLLPSSLTIFNCLAKYVHICFNTEFFRPLATSCCLSTSYLFHNNDTL